MENISKNSDPKLDQSNPSKISQHFAVINDPEEVSKLQSKMGDLMVANSHGKVSLGEIAYWCQLIVPNGDEVWYLYNLHKNLPGSRSDRHWNVFGWGKYKYWDMGEFELNIPLTEDRRMQGAFVGDELGKRYLVHRGGFMGKKRMMKRKFFMDRFNGKVIAAGEGRKLQNFAVIACLDDPGEKFIANVVAFFKEVKRIKEEFNSNT